LLHDEIAITEVAQRAAAESTFFIFIRLCWLKCEKMVNCGCKLAIKIMSGNNIYLNN